MRNNLMIDVINLHVTEKCNYRCVNCIGKFNIRKELKLEEWKKVVDKVSEYFNKNNLMGRINISGGEPTCLPFLIDLINYIHSKSIKVSIISNASKLTFDYIDKLVGKVEIIGISIDSIKYDINLKLGRYEGENNVLKYNDLVNILKYIKMKNIKIKINTVVSKINLNEDIALLYNEIEFDRIKVLQMRVNYGSNDESQKYEITDEEFLEYKKRLSNKVKQNIIFESSEDIENAYVIIDPFGNMISNNNKKHIIVGNILKNDIEKLISYAKVDSEKFSKRYCIKE